MYFTKGVFFGHHTWMLRILTVRMQDNILAMRSAIFRLLDEPNLLSRMEANVNVKRLQSSFKQVAQSLQSFARTIILKVSQQESRN